MVIGTVVAVLVIVVVTVWAAGNGARGDIDAAVQRASAADATAAELRGDLAELRGDLQDRAGEIDRLRDELEALTTELAQSRAAGSEAADVADAAAAAEADANEDAATASSLAEVTTAVAETDDVEIALHVTDVVDGNVLVGFDLREMLADGPDAGRAIQVRLAGTDAPAPGDCRHTQSSALTEAWLEATDGDVLLRRPADAPETDALGRRLAEVLALSNPDSSLNVTLTVAGEAILDTDQVDDDPFLTERLRVAQASAEGTGVGVWGCEESVLLGTAPAPTTSPSGTPTASPTPTPTG